jgi:hypothetical protein
MTAAASRLRQFLLVEVAGQPFRLWHTGSMRSPLLAVALVVVGSLSVAGAQRVGAPENFYALAVQPGAGPGEATIPLNFLVSRWSTPAERDAILDTLLERPTKILEVLQKMPAVGRLTTPGSVGFELRYAQKISSGGTDRIMLLTDRPVSFGEVADRSRTLDYPLTLIELRVPPSTRGDGKIAIAARLTADPRTRQLMVEDWNFAPIMLQSVERERR